MSILVNTGPTTLTKTWYVDGTATDPSGTVTIGIVDGDGATVVAASTATSNPSTGVYTYALDVQATPKQLTVSWTTGTQTLTDIVDIVGGWLFTESELRAYYGSDLADETVYPDKYLGEGRDRVTAEFERICGVSFVPRWRREIYAGDGRVKLEVQRGHISSVVAASVNSVDVSSSTEAHPERTYLYRTSGAWTKATQASPFNCDVSYIHGYPAVPGDIKIAALTVARTQLTRIVTGQGIPVNASSWQDGSGNFGFAANNENGRWFAIPEVDTKLKDYVERTGLA